MKSSRNVKNGCVSSTITTQLSPRKRTRELSYNCGCSHVRCQRAKHHETNSKSRDHTGLSRLLNSEYQYTSVLIGLVQRIWKKYGEKGEKEPRSETHILPAPKPMIPEASINMTCQDRKTYILLCGWHPLYYTPVLSGYHLRIARWTESSPTKEEEEEVLGDLLWIIGCSSTFSDAKARASCVTEFFWRCYEYATHPFSRNTYSSTEHSPRPISSVSWWASNRYDLASQLLALAWSRMASTRSDSFQPLRSTCYELRVRERIFFLCQANDSWFSSNLYKPIRAPKMPQWLAKQMSNTYYHSV